MPGGAIFTIDIVYASGGSFFSDMAEKADLRSNPPETFLHKERKSLEILHFSLIF